MRKSIVLIAAITAPLLAVVACGPSHDTPPKDTIVKGTVSKKEYEAAKTKSKKVTYMKRVCTTRQGKKTCTNVKAGHRTVTETKPECYELTIKLDRTGKELEICNRAAFNALTEGDRYSSAINYATVTR
jgi:hypothetical protein